ncbi:cytochrome P450 [Amylostereum chailletii]|nr:cytochrome P450 [Amylostereum chailletii]
MVSVKSSDIPITYRDPALSLPSQYAGELISLNILGKIIVVINTQRVAKDLLEKGGAIISGRPDILFAEMVGWMRNNVSMLPYRQRWHERRRVMDPSLRPNSIPDYHHILHDHASSMVRAIIAEPDKAAELLTYCMASIIASVVYGYDITGMEDEFISVAERVGDYGKHLRLGALLVNHIPLLHHLPSWFPGCGFQALIQKAKQDTQNMIDSPFESVKVKMACTLPCILSHPAPQSLMKYFLIVQAAGIARPSITSTTLSGLLLALCQYPSVQRSAQEELDRVIGRDKLPDFSDRANLPYLNAICQELLRWKVVIPLGIPHAAMEDSTYEGYFIPKVPLTQNITRSILHDAERYPEPLSFKPERFISADGKFIEDSTVSAAFGFGKRKCPGRHFADASMWAFVALLLATSEVSDARDEKGEKFGDNIEWVDGFLSHPPKFTFKIVPRDKTA